MNSAADLLHHALVRLASNGRRPRCGEYGGHALWCSDDPAERAQAATWCTGCPVLTECGAAAAETKATFGVWAGVDRTTRTQPDKNQPPSPR